MHPLLKRQLRKIGVDDAALPSLEAWRELLERVSATYVQADQDRYMLERSLERSSEEMGCLYDELRTTSAAEIAKKGEELSASLSLVTGVVESVADAILVVDAVGTVLNFNRRFLEVFGIDRDLESTLRRGEQHESLLWKHCAPLFLNSEAVRLRVRALVAEPNVVATDEIELVDGRILSRYSSPLTRHDGGVRARLWCFRDITEERKLASHRAVVSERMASVGQLVASVAHEINNPLAYIAGNVELVSESIRTDGPTGNGEREELIDALKDATTGVERIKVIVRDLRMLSRVDEDTREPTNLQSVIGTALQIANNELRHRAQVVKLLEPTPLVSANSVRLGQVFLNLLVNAAHAMADGRASENCVTVSTTTLASGFACVRIHDTGSGIAPEHLERIFDPFFTTKPVGSGTGLGLSICKGIIDKLGGTIEVTSVLGSGTTFSVILPPAAPTNALGPRGGRPSTAPSAIPAPPRRTVLVVDDDAQIRRWFQRTLSHEHDVTTVSSVEAAEELLKTTQSFDAILCDVMMPNRTGLDMHSLVKAQRPDLLRRLIFMSGGAFTPTLSAFLEQVPNTCLRKPFPKAELERAISAAAAMR